MRIIPVLDLKAGRAVHAVAGWRSEYRPLRSVVAVDSDPVAIARGLRDRLGATEVYVADLDAIVARVGPAYPTLRAIAALGLAVWADVGIEDEAGVGPLMDAGVARIVAGLETLRGPEELRGIVAAGGADRAVFSLDLRAGVPIVPRDHGWRGDTADEANLVAQAVEVGIRTLIRLDLASVGTGRGVANIPPVGTAGVEWITGGGVAGVDDLATLARLGYAGALVGSAVHDGRIGRVGADSPGGG